MCTHKEGPGLFDSHLEGLSVPSFGAQNGPIPLYFEHTHPGSLRGKPMSRGPDSKRAMVVGSDTAWPKSISMAVYL